MSYIDENIILFMTIGYGYINKEGYLEIIKPYYSEIKCMEYKNNMTYNLP